MNKLTLAVVVVLVALSQTLPCRADDPCSPPGYVKEGTPGAVYLGVDQHTGAKLWGAPERPASAWNACKETGFIAGYVAQYRDKKVPQSEIPILILQQFPSLQNIASTPAARLDYVNTHYVQPIYQSLLPWHDICTEYTNNCNQATPTATQK